MRGLVIHYVCETVSDLAADPQIRRTSPPPSPRLERPFTHPPAPRQVVLGQVSGLLAKDRGAVQNHSGDPLASRCRTVKIGTSSFQNILGESVHPIRPALRAA